MFPKIDNALLNIGSGANQIVQLGTGGKLPAVDASLLNNLPANVGASAMSLLLTQTISSPVSQIDFTTNIDATYKEYMVRGSDITFSSSSGLGVRARVGGAFKTTGYTYATVGFGNAFASAVSTSSNDSYFLIIPTYQSLVATYGNGGFVFSLTNPAGTSRTKAMYVTGGGNGNNYNQGHSYYSGGQYNGNTDTSPIDGLRLFPVSGVNITSGIFKLYGIA